MSSIRSLPNLVEVVLELEYVAGGDRVAARQSGTRTRNIIDVVGRVTTERCGTFAVLPVDKYRDSVVVHRVAQGDVLVPAVGCDPPLDGLREIEYDIVPTGLRQLGLGVDEVHVHRAVKYRVTDLHPCDDRTVICIQVRLRHPDPRRDCGLVVGYVEINRANGLGSPDTQLNTRVVIRVGGLDELDYGVGCILRIRRQRDLILCALEPNHIVARSSTLKIEPGKVGLATTLAGVCARDR